MCMVKGVAGGFFFFLFFLFSKTLYVSTSVIGAISVGFLLERLVAASFALSYLFIFIYLFIKVCISILLCSPWSVSTKDRN